MRRSTIGKKVEASILALNACKVRSTPDWGIAKGLLQESCGYIRIGDYVQAELFHKAALPYLRFAELAS